jgi:tol-pal system protein YbgF
MTTRLPRLLAALTTLPLVLLVARPATAANKEHQQLMADLRILQEQSQLLQNMLGTLGDAIKAVNARLDQQAETDRRTVADEKLLIDTLTNDLRVVREKVDDNNVRIGSLSQEVDALRQLVQQVLTRLTAPPVVDPNAPPALAGAAPVPLPPAATTPASGASPSKTYQQAFSDYTSGLWDLAIDGFEAFLRDFPTATQAPDAQFYIARSYLNDGRYDKAVDACELVIRNYPMSTNVPDAYFIEGVAFTNLKQPDRAREAWDTVIKNYPDSPAASLARQRMAKPQ